MPASGTRVTAAPLRADARRARPPALGRGLLALLALAAALAGLVVALTGGGARRPQQGAVRFLGGSNQAFDAYTSGRDPAYGAFLRQHFSRMIVYSPYFDDKTSWYPRGWVYKDAYAIYRGSALAGEHPQWILKDGAGNPLFIPFACAQGSCPQYAGDISNPEFRSYWIASARATLAHGYHGLFIDDVNMEQRVSDGSGTLVAPIDDATGQPMTAEAWRRYMSVFMQEVRAALPGVEIAHNVEWLADTPRRASDALIAAEIRAADYVNLERGVNDTGIRGGDGPYSLSGFLAYIDSVHALGRGVVLDGSASESAGIEYSLAAYLLISTGNDLVSAKGMTPDHWFSGFDLNLGQALGPRREWMGLLRRDFAGGIALVGAPESGSHSALLPAPMRTLAGQTVSSVTLGPASGVVLLRR
ncbi:MAG TPA: putative glycoside hydrolase [Solirubrobacteraceae bacterium]|nr:putative glycoside hydrolase [Solirubrobacteraceae bacterium]